MQVYCELGCDTRFCQFLVSPAARADYHAPMPPGTLPTPSAAVVDVAIGILLRTCEGPNGGQATQILITRRPRGTVYADFWEFPGGKLDPGETPAQALIREFEEELALRITPGQALPPIEHVYPHGHVRLHPYLCSCPPKATPVNRHVAEHRWVRTADLGRYRFPEANATILAFLQSHLDQIEA
jgi:8-oxo-dGTP diphosphatase